MKERTMGKTWSLGEESRQVSVPLCHSCHTLHMCIAPRIPPLFRISALSNVTCHISFVTCHSYFVTCHNLTNGIGHLARVLNQVQPTPTCQQLTRFRTAHNQQRNSYDKGDCNAFNSSAPKRISKNDFLFHTNFVHILYPVYRHVPLTPPVQNLVPVNM